MNALGKAVKEIIFLIFKRIELIEIVQDCFQLCVHIHEAECSKAKVLFPDECKKKTYLRYQVKF
jgi:putative ribosome biogenesis GTPase RsgA